VSRFLPGQKHAPAAACHCARPSDVISNKQHKKWIKKMISKIHIFGGPGSGKSYLATQLEQLLNISSNNLDNIFWDNSQSNYNKKQDSKKRNNLLEEILSHDSWIIEGVYYDWVYKSFHKSDVIIIIKPSVVIRSARIIKRFIFRKLRILKSNKKETFRGLIKLLRWNSNFDNDNFKLALEVLEPFKQKTFSFNSADKALQYLRKDVACCL
jgi:adenylate kinase family enzyme